MGAVSKLKPLVAVTLCCSFVKGFTRSSLNRHRVQEEKAYNSVVLKTTADDVVDLDGVGGGRWYSRKSAFDHIVMSRFACKRFERFDSGNDDSKEATKSNPEIVQQAFHCLELARRAPSGFNTQPYKLILVQSQQQKQALARYALGPNRQRVLDSDCTAVFLADREVLRTLGHLAACEKEWYARKPNRFLLWQTRFYIACFSQGFPLPRFFAAPISFFFRLAMSIMELFISWFYVLPSLSSAESWTFKQTSFVAMTYMLACTSRGLATIPMEGINAAGIRKVLKVPRRYSVPLIVSTGVAAPSQPSSVIKNSTVTPRYPMEEIIYSDEFGSNLCLLPESG